MSIQAEDSRRMDFDRRKVFNVPNQFTSVRLVLAIVLFWLIAEQHYLAGDVRLHRRRRHRLGRRLLRPHATTR